MSIKDLAYKVPGLSFDVNRLVDTYREIKRKKEFDQGDGSVSHIDSISQVMKIVLRENIHGDFIGQNQIVQAKKWLEQIILKKTILQSFYQSLKTHILNLFTIYCLGDSLWEELEY